MSNLINLATSQISFRNKSERFLAVKFYLCIYPKKYLEKLEKHLWHGLFCESCLIRDHTAYVKSISLIKILRETQQR